MTTPAHPERAHQAPSASGVDVLGEHVVRERLRRARVARLGYLDELGPAVVPINVATDAEGRVVWRTAAEGPLARLDGRRVAVEVDGVDSGDRGGWSILLRGRARDVSSDDDLVAVSARRAAVDCWAPGTRDRVFVLITSHVTARAISGHDWLAGVPLS